MDFTSLAPIVPTIGTVATALVATVAIIVTRNSNQRNIKKDIELKKWEKRASAYSELVAMLDRQDPSRAPSTEEVAREAQSGSAALTNVPLDEDEWREFDITVRLYASSNVATLYWVWKTTFADWTMSRASIVVNEGKWEASTTTEREAFERELGYRNRLANIRREVLLNVRSELDFRKQRPSVVRRLSGNEVSVVIPDGVADADLEVFVGNDPDYATAVRKAPNGWKVEVRLATGTKTEDMMKVEKWRL